MSTSTNRRYAFPTPKEALPFSGERYVPNVGDQIQHEHFHRYLFALQFCADKDVLDLACGEGYGAALLGGVARSVIGVDSSADSVAHADRQYAAGNVTFVESDACATPLPDDAVDTVVCFETIEHLSDHEGLIAEIRRVLRPGGLLLLSTPDRDTYLAGEEPNQFHVRELSRPELIELLKTRFLHVTVGGQESGSGSTIITTHGSSVDASYFSRRGTSEFEAASGPTRPTYLIALASDEALPAAGPSTLMDVHHLPALHESYRQELERLWAELDARNNDREQLRAELNARSTEVEQLTTELQARDIDLERLKTDRSALEEAVERLGAERDAREFEVEQSISAAREKARNLARERDLLHQQHDAVQAELRAAYSSASWRMTRPMRVAKRGARRAVARVRRKAAALRTRLTLRRVSRPQRESVNENLAKHPLLELESEQSLPAHLRDDAILSAAVLWARQHGPHRDIERLEYQPLVSVLLPTYNTPLDVLELAVASVRSQSYEHWELVIVDDGSTSDELREYLGPLSECDPRIRVALEATNRGISAATNAALALATGELIAMLDHDDELLPEALAEVVKAFASDASLNAVYTDQEYIERDGTPSGTLHKPDWSPRLFWGVMYVGHLLVVRRSVAASAGGFDSLYDNVQDFEFMLRISEQTGRIGHVPRVLYRWRRIPGSVAFHGDEKPEIEELQAAAVNAHLCRTGLRAVARPHLRHAHRLTILPGTHKPISLSVIVTGDDAPARTRTRDSVVAAASRADEDIVFVDTESLDAAVRELSTDFLMSIDAGLVLDAPDWLDHLVLHAGCRDVGVVAPVILDENGLVEQAGLITGVTDGWKPAMVGWDPADDGYAGSLSCAREVSAISASCALISRDTLTALGGFAAAIKSAKHSWLELSLRATGAGMWNVVTPLASARRITPADDRDNGILDSELVIDRWGRALGADRFHNPNFADVPGGYAL